MPPISMLTRDFPMLFDDDLVGLILDAARVGGRRQFRSGCVQCPLEHEKKRSEESE